MPIILGLIMVAKWPHSGKKLFPWLAICSLCIRSICCYSYFHFCFQALRERLRTHKVFTKDQCFYFNYHKFSIKSYVLDVY